MYYAIEKIGYGKRTRYTLRKVTKTGIVCPVDGKCYPTEEAAQIAAAAQGLNIAKCGDLWQIIPGI